VSSTIALRIVAAAALVILPACAELSFLHPAKGLEFELTGRIAVRYNHEGSSGNIAWRHRAQGDELLITSPLGQGVARIERDGEVVSVTTSDRRVYRARDAESLTEQVLGFRVPLAGLADWVRARPAPGPARETKDASGRLREIRQNGWQIDYLAYGDAGALPTRLRLTYPGLEIRLAISEWQTRP